MNTLNVWTIPPAILDTFVSSIRANQKYTLKSTLPLKVWITGNCTSFSRPRGCTFEPHPLTLALKEFLLSFVDF